MGAEQDASGTFLMHEIRLGIHLKRIKHPYPWQTRAHEQLRTRHVVRIALLISFTLIQPIMCPDDAVSARNKRKYGLRSTGIYARQASVIFVPMQAHMGTNETEMVPARRPWLNAKKRRPT